MARLRYLDADDLTGADREIVRRGMNLHRALAHSPEAARRYSGLARHLRFDSALNPRIREMAMLQVIYLARSAYAYSHHLRLAREAGVSDADVAAIAVESDGGDSGLPEFERTVLRAARELAAGTRLSDTTWGGLRAGLGEADLLDLLMAITFYTGAVRLLGALEIDVEPDFLAELERHPLPGV